MNENENTVQVSKAELERAIAILKEIAEKPKPIKYPKRLGIVINEDNHGFRISQIVYSVDDKPWSDKYADWVDATGRQQVLENSQLIIYTR